MTRSSRGRKVAVGAAAVSALLVASTAIAAPVTWTSFQLAPDGNAPAGATTPAGDAAVAWWLPSIGGIVSSDGIGLATGSGETFSSSVITTSDLAYPDLAYGADGTAHIAAMVEIGSGGLSYVAYAGGIATETLVTADFLADQPAIGVDGAGQPRIAYATGAGVSVATLDAGTWTSELIWSGTAIKPRLAVEAGGASHVVWIPIDNETGNGLGVLYATDASGTWAVQQVSTNAADTQPDVAVESTGVVDIVFARQSAHGGGVIWQRLGARAKVIARGIVDSPAIAIGPGDAIHVAYWDFGQRSLGLHRTTNATGRFVDSLVSDLGEGGSPMTITVTPDGTAYLGYTVPGTCCPATGGLFVAHD